MLKKITLLLSCWAMLSISAFAQKWGYVTLIASQGSTAVQLLDTNSVVVKQWSGLSGGTGYSSYLTEGGDLWRAVKAASTSLNGGGVSGRVQKVAWNGAVLFDYTISDANQVSHHDFCPMPNGNVLMIVYEKKTAAEVQAAGATINAVRWSEKVIELKPTGVNTAQIVWEWHLWDHLCQNLYPAKANYQASIVNHPELLNVNYNNNSNNPDWVHMNGIDYNATLDQIVVSSHNLNELWILDHSTTTVQAASHSGGVSGKGGDLLYRWGNPAAYGVSGPTIFNVVHDAHWVPADCPRAGWLGGFNNRGVSNTTSSVDLFQPPWNGTSYTLTPGQAYQPATYGYRHPASGYSSNMGSSQQLPNGNMLICLATAGKVYEINANGTQLWQYTTTGAIPQAKRYSRCFLENPKVAVVTPNSTICSGGSVQLDITPAATNVNAYSYNWGSAAGLSSSSVQDPLVSGITASTTYTVTVTTAGGCSATASIPVTVSPPPTADAGKDVAIQSGQSTMLTATGGVTYSWSTGASTANTTVSPTTTSTYTVTVTAANGCTATDMVEVRVSSPISANAAASVSAFCLGGNTQLLVSAQGGNGNFTYAWSSIPAGFTSTLSQPTVMPTVSTIYIVTVSDGQATATATAAVTVYPLPLANAGPDVSIVAGQSTVLQASGGATYRWSTGATTANITVSPIANTTYTVTVTSGNGCTATDKVLVTVVPPVLVTATADKLAFCTGGSAQLSALATGGNGAFTYAWTSTPSGFTSTLSNPVVAPTQSTTYKVVVSDGLSSATTSVAITVFPLPLADAGSDVSVLIGSSTMLTAVGGETYEWSNGNTGPSITVSPVLTTTYTVTVTNAAGCTATDAVTVTVTGSVLSAVVSASQNLVCLGEATQLSAVASGGTGNYTYEWSANGAVFSAAQNPLVSPSGYTEYLVRVSDGLSTFSDSFAVNVRPLPKVDAGSDVLIFLGDQAVLTASGGSTYHWNTGANTASIPVSPTVTTTYTVTATDANGCTASDAVTVNINAILPLTGSVSANDTAICLGDVVQLLASATNGTGNYTYLWSSSPAGFTSSLPDPFVNPEETTTYTVEISDGLRSISRSLAIVVNPLAPQPVITTTGGALVSSSLVNNQWFYYGNPIPGATGQVFNPAQAGSYQVQVVDQNGCSSPLSDPYEYIATLPLSGSISANDTVVCLGDVVQLLASATNGTGQYTYAWTSQPPGFTSTLPDPFVNPEESTLYTVKISDGTSNLALSLDIIVNPLAPQPLISVSGGALVSSSLVNNQWFYYGNAIPGATGQVFNPVQSGSYQVQVLDANGCFSPLSEPYEFLNTATGQALPAEKWALAPNPATDQFLLLGDFDRSDFWVELRNSAGKLVLQRRNADKVSVALLPAGVYWLRLQTNQGTGVRKLMIIK